MRYTQLGNGVFVPKVREKFGYSDGSQAEEYLKQIVQQTKDRSTLSSELVTSCRDWVTLYHLSPQRSHLLRPLTHLLKDKLVLELGAGCGAITRFLGETARRVVALEGSEKRAEIAAMRCSDLNTVTIINDTIQELQVPQLFDVVTLIGVLEYARVYDKETDNPERNILRIARRFLKPGGCLILALENQLGIKYLAGSKEDHIQQHFWGVHDLYHRDSVVTFGRKELESLILAAGFAKVDQLIPLPDYKLPVSVLHPESFSDEGSQHIDITPFLLNSIQYDRQRSSPHCFSLEAIASPLVRNGLIKDLCNSLFFIASVNEKAEPLPAEILVSHYGAARFRQFAKETLFVMVDGEVQVRREYLAQDIARSNASIANIIQPVENYIKGKLFHEGLVTIMNTPGWSPQAIADWASPWLEYMDNFSTVGEDNKKNIPSSAMDMIPLNFLVDENGKLIPFDLEWCFDGNETIPFSYAAIRGLFIALASFSNVGKPANGVPTNVLEIILNTLALKGITPPSDEIMFFANEFRKLSISAVGGAPLIEELFAQELTVRTLA